MRCTNDNPGSAYLHLQLCYGPLKSNAELMGEPISLSLYRHSKFGCDTLSYRFEFPHTYRRFSQDRHQYSFLHNACGQAELAVRTAFEAHFYGFILSCSDILGCSARNAFRRLLVQRLEQCGDKVRFTLS